MRLMTQGYVAVLGLILLAPSAVGLLDTGEGIFSFRFNGELKISEAVQVQGLIAPGANESYLASWRPNGAEAGPSNTGLVPVGRLPNVVVSVKEWNETGIGLNQSVISWSGLPSDSPMNDPSGKTYWLSDAVVYIERLGPDAQWISLGSRDSAWIDEDVSRLQLAADCALRPAVFRPADFGDQRYQVAVTEDGKSLDGTKAVGARCRANNMSLFGEYHLVFFDVFLRIDYDTESDDPGTLRIRTGKFSQPSGPAGQLESHYLRIAELQPFSLCGPAEFHYDGQLEVDLVSPLIAVKGDVDVPPSVGKMEWGRWRRTGEIPKVSSPGTYSFRPHERLDLAINGWASRGPPEPSMPGSEVSVPVAAVAALLLAAGLGAYRLWPMALRLFTRFQSSDVLKHPRRAAILQAISENPGISIQELAECLSLKRSIVVHHVHMLASQSLLEVSRVKGRTSLFPAGPTPSAERAKTSLLRRPMARRVLRARTEHPDWSQAQLAADLGMSQSNVSRWLRTLGAAGLLAGTESRATAQ